MQAARDLLAAKGVNQVYANAIPNIVQRAKDQFLADNLSYQKDLNEVAVIVAQTEAGKDKEIGEQMAKIYANDFTEQEMKDLTAFYKSPLGQKLSATGAEIDPGQHALHESMGAGLGRDGRQ